MFKTDGMNKRSAIRYLETKYDLLEENFKKDFNLLDRKYKTLSNKYEVLLLSNKLINYGLTLIYVEGQYESYYKIIDKEGEKIFFTLEGLDSVKQRFEGYKKGFEQPIDILVEAEEEQTDEELDKIYNDKLDKFYKKQVNNSISDLKEIQKQIKEERKSKKSK